MKKNNIKTLTYSAMLAAIGTALSFFRIPLTNITEITLTGLPIVVGGYFFGPAAGAAVGAGGVVIYCLLTSGLRGMPGWSLGNAVIGVLLGGGLRLCAKIRPRTVRAFAHLALIVLATAVGILGVKSLTECLLYAQPFAVRTAKNMAAFIADAVMLAVSLPAAAFLDGRTGKAKEHRALPS